MVELKCPFKGKDDRIALNKNPTISTKEKRRAEESKALESLSCLSKESLSKGAVDINEHFIVGVATP